MKDKTPNKNTSKWHILIKIALRSNILKDILNFNHLTIITS